MKNITAPKTLDPVLPVAKGMKVLFVGYIPMGDILPSKWGTNANRPAGPDPKKVSQHARCIREGNYVPERYEPPVLVKSDIEGKFDQCTGSHRHLGHEDAGATTFYAAVVEFFDCEGKSADYWRFIYQSNENREDTGKEVPKNFRGDEGVISTVLTMIDNGVISSDPKSIQVALEDQYYGRTTEKGKNLLNKIRAELGHVNGVTRLYSKLDVARVITEETTPMTSVIVRTMKDSTGNDKDYDVRLVSSIMSVYKTSKKYINVFLHWSGLNPHEIIKAREVKDNFLETQYFEAKEFVEAYESGHLERRITVRYLPQIEGEYSREELRQAA
jgi:hypothetical protein